jgi:hypothetical protein
MIVFPIVYLIIGRSLQEFLNTIKKRKLLYFSCLTIFLFFLILPFYNTYKIYPYYELDGYKYGANFIGYNKASFLSFEGISAVNEYLEKETPETSDVVIYLTDLSSPSMYNYTFANFMYYPKKNLDKYIRANSKEDVESGSYNYILLHLYTKDTKLPSNCILSRTFAIDTIKTFFLYKC